MIPIVETGKKKGVVGSMLSQDISITAGRQNLLSSIWGGRKQVVGMSTMPNGDPPSLMLWGDEDDRPDRRYGRRP